MKTPSHVCHAKGWDFQPILVYFHFLRLRRCGSVLDSRPKRLWGEDKNAMSLMHKAKRAKSNNPKWAENTTTPEILIDKALDSRAKGTYSHYPDCNRRA